jgi:RNA polymerase sigma factor (sigma-70 family)
MPLAASGPGPPEDIVAETFLAAFRHRDRYDTTRHDARPWLYGIAGNLIRRHHRDEVRQLRALARTGVDPTAESFTERSDARLAADASSRAVAAAIAALDPDQRDVVLLITWAQLTYDQVAEALGVPEGTVPAPLGWPSASYPYLESLPTNPARLTALIKANLKAEPDPIGADGEGNVGVFNAIQALMENVVLPPRLLAGLYGVQARDPAVRFRSLGHRHRGPGRGRLLHGAGGLPQG